MNQPTGEELVRRYRQVVCLPPEVEITEEMVLAHWELEQRLTREILESTPENRWETFERCYSTLFSELAWRNRLPDLSVQKEPSERYRDWLSLIGKPPQRIYEIGSGKAELISYLANCGFQCKATEVTRERGEKYAEANANLSWGVTDGVHLDQFEPAESYDVVISDQLVEHLHPDDHYAHFKGAHAILSPGGRYVFQTPHAFRGPLDISMFFGCDKPRGMHLHEFTYRELNRILRKAGFRRISALISLPRKAKRLLSEPKASNGYLRYCLVLESLLGLLPRQSMRRASLRFARLLLFPNSVFIVAER